MMWQPTLKQKVLTWFRVWYWRGRTRCENHLFNIRRKLPYLVWQNDEVDVVVTLPNEPPVPPEIQQSRVLRLLYEGAYREIEGRLLEAGVKVPTNNHPCGHEWVLGADLQGPVSIRFICPVRSRRFPYARKLGRERLERGKSILATQNWYYS